MSGNTFRVYKELPPASKLDIPWFSSDWSSSAIFRSRWSAQYTARRSERRAPEDEVRRRVPWAMNILLLIEAGLARSTDPRMRNHYVSVLRGRVSIGGPAVTDQERELIHEFFSQHFPPVYLSQALDTRVFGEVFRGGGYGSVIFISYDLAVAANATKSIPKSNNAECAASWSSLSRSIMNLLTYTIRIFTREISSSLHLKRCSTTIV
ncbi:hypothetical protein IW262DRAFT_327214 [Armillaria fumosa]|nr:hypothetical protein IW262DRAFT_327214 [Armillaria fumosa]